MRSSDRLVFISLRELLSLHIMDHKYFKAAHFSHFYIYLNIGCSMFFVAMHQDFACFYAKTVLLFIIQCTKWTIISFKTQKAKTLEIRSNCSAATNQYFLLQLHQVVELLAAQCVVIDHAHTVKWVIVRVKAATERIH